jgi:hypothetical protein
MSDMTSYWLKETDGKTHHFRVTPTYNGVDVVEGVFYHWISSFFIGCDSGKAAIAKANELVEAHMADGFVLTDFEETPENTSDVYDKAKWHFDGNFPAELEIFQGYIHTGMFLGWLIDNNMVNAELAQDIEADIAAFKKRELTGSQIFESQLDGVLMLENINETGNRFALHYFDFDSGQFLEDYETTLADDLLTMYHVKDTWENYHKLKPVLDRRFAEWKKGQ